MKSPKVYFAYLQQKHLEDLDFPSENSIKDVLERFSEEDFCRVDGNTYRKYVEKMNLLKEEENNLNSLLIIENVTLPEFVHRIQSQVQKSIYTTRKYKLFFENAIKITKENIYEVLHSKKDMRNAYFYCIFEVENIFSKPEREKIMDLSRQIKGVQSQNSVKIKKKSFKNDAEYKIARETVSYKLINLTNTCFINSVIQCLIHCQEFRNYLFANEAILEDKNLEIAAELCKVFKKLQNFGSESNNSSSPINLTRFRDLLHQKTKNNMFLEYKQQDATEFLFVLFNALIEEFKTLEKSEPSMPLNGRNPQFDQYFQFINKIRENSENQTIIAKLFQGFFLRKLKCEKCNGKNSSSNEESFLNINLSFPYKIIYFSKKNTTQIHKLFFNRSSCDRKNEIDIQDYKKFIKENDPSVIEKELEIFTFDSFNPNKEEFYQTNFNSDFDGDGDKVEDNHENEIFIKEFDSNELRELQKPILFFMNIYNQSKFMGFTYFIGDITTTYKDAYLNVYAMLQKIPQKEINEFITKFEKEFITKFVEKNNKINRKEAHFLLYLKQGFSNRAFQELDYDGKKFILENSNIISLKVEIKNNSLIKNLNLGYHLNIQDLLDFFFKSEKLEDKSCEICNERQIKKKTKIQICPNNIILMLGRFNQEVSQESFSKNQTNLSLNSEINLHKYVKCHEFNFDIRKIQYKVFVKKEKNLEPDRNCVYELFAICQHKGVDIFNGHYISFCKSYEKGKWSKYNDDKTIESIDIEKYLNYNKDAYMLFYKKKI